MPFDLSLAELARYIDETPERLREWQGRGLIGTPAEADRFTHIDLERARLVRLFLRRGIDLDVIARSLRASAIQEQLGHRRRPPTGVHPLQPAHARPPLTRLHPPTCAVAARSLSE